MQSKEQVEQRREEFHRTARWNRFRLGVPFTGACWGMSMVYFFMGTLNPVWYLGPAMFLAALVLFFLGWKEEFKGIRLEDPETGHGAFYIFMAVMVMLLGIFVPPLLA